MAGGEYSDDPTIPNDAELWRRIHPVHIYYDKNKGRWRPSTAAFENHPNGSPMSVLLGEMVLGSGRGPLDIMKDMHSPRSRLVLHGSATKVLRVSLCPMNLLMRW